MQLCGRGCGKEGGKSVKQYVQLITIILNLEVKPVNLQSIEVIPTMLPRILLILVIATGAHMQNLAVSGPTTVDSIINTVNSLLTGSANSPKAQPQLRTQAPKQNPEVFNDVTLIHHLPSTFLLNEVFQFEGSVNLSRLRSFLSTQPPNTNRYFLNFVFIEQGTGEQTTFKKSMKHTETKFTQQCHFKKAGSFYLGVFLGSKASITPRILQVVDSNQIPQRPVLSSVVPSRPEDLSLHVNGNDLFIRWKPKTCLTRVQVTQKYPYVNSKEFILSNDASQFQVPFAEFSNFTKAPTKITISHAHSSDISASERSTQFSEPLATEVNVTEHLFQEIRYAEIELDSDIQSMVQVSDEVVIDGSSQQQINTKAIIVDPRNGISQQKLDIVSDQSKSKFKLRHKIHDEGIYIIEINHAHGYALVNTPIYAGNSYPLLPDYADLQQQGKAKPADDDLSLKQMRELLLRLINERRKAFGVEPVVLDSELNVLAQKHSDDMGVRNYVSHKNLQGLNSGDRAKKMNIFSPVGENIAVNENLEYAQYRLDRSPEHLINTVNPQWTRVGIGIYKKYNGVYYITQEFSCEDLARSPFTEEDKIDIQTQILQALNSNAPSRIIQNKALSKDLQQWYQLNSFGSAGITPIARKHGVGNGKILNFRAPHVTNFIQLVEKAGYFKYAGFGNVGLAFKLDKGVLDAIMILF